jgi:RNA polymerase sigma-70 factor (ECF subfamily)
MNQRRRIHAVFMDRAQALQVFFRKRLGRLRDTRDLTQEVYLRLLRAGEGRAILNPEAYLFTVANNLLKERRVMERREAERLNLSYPVAEEEAPDPGIDLDRETRRRYLRLVLPELSPRERMVLFLTFEEELTQQQIAQQLGVSRPLVGRIISQAVLRCRERMAELEVR